MIILDSFENVMIASMEDYLSLMTVPILACSFLIISNQLEITYVLGLLKYHKIGNRITSSYFHKNNFSNCTSAIENTEK